jgi:hypothetical protein
MTVAPGKEVLLHAQLDLKGLSGGLDKKLRVLTNDPRQPNTFLSFVGEVTWRVRLSQEFIRFGRLEPHDSPTETVDLKTIDGLRLRIDEARTSSPQVAINVHELTEGSHYRIDTSLQPPLREGHLSGWVELATDDESSYQRIRIPFSASVMPIGTLTRTSHNTVVSDLTAFVADVRE